MARDTADADADSYHCEACGEEFETKQELVEHVRDVGIAK